MLKNEGKFELGFGKINDDDVLSYICEFASPNSVLKQKISVTRFIDPNTDYRLFMYKDNLYSLKELRLEYLKELYNVE